MSLSGKKIQTKPSKPLSVEETAEKLRALREKQSMWMKERETEKYSSGSKTRKDSKSSAKSGSAFSSDSSKLNGRTSSSSFSSSETKHNDSRGPYSNPRRKPLYPEPKRDHSDVISWIVKGDGQSSKNKRPPSGAGQHNRHNSTSRSLSRNGTRTLSSKSDSLASREYKASNYSTSGKSGGVGVTAQPQKLHNKRRPSSRSSVRSDSGSVEDEKVTNVLHHEESSFVDDNEEVIGTHQPKTVNKDLASNIQRDLSKLQSGDIPPEMIAALADTVAERLQSLHGDQVNKRTTPLYGSQKPNAEHGMASHFCSLCNELMTPPRHTPMAVIPCGHSFCKACLRDCRKCPTCQTRINSSAVNTVLQAIIADFNAQKEKERLQQLEEQARIYVDEYQSLSMRSGALTGISIKTEAK